MVTKNIFVHRHELKYLISQTDYIYLRSILNTVLQPDRNAISKNGYFIRSLYFDTYSNRDFEEKIIGINERRKIRLRIYSTNDNDVKLEIKSKNNVYSIKETTIITREDALQLVKGNTDVLLKYNNSVAYKAYSYFKKDLHIPTVLIDYEREAYFAPIENIRITFDKNVRAAKSDELFVLNVPMSGLHSSLVTIMEVKYDRYFPKYITQILSSCNLQNLSISKYCTARQMIDIE